MCACGVLCANFVSAWMCDCAEVCNYFFMSEKYLKIKLLPHRKHHVGSWTEIVTAAAAKSFESSDQITS
jgi:hypothetical protein